MWFIFHMPPRRRLARVPVTAVARNTRARALARQRAQNIQYTARQQRVIQRRRQQAQLTDAERQQQRDATTTRLERLASRLRRVPRYGLADRTNHLDVGVSTYRTSALGNLITSNLITATLDDGEPYASFEDFIRDTRDEIINILTDEYHEHPGIKFSLTLHANFVDASVTSSVVHVDELGNTEAREVTSISPVMSTVMITVLQPTRIEANLQVLINELRDRIDKFLVRGSNWALQSIISIEVNTLQYVPPVRNFFAQAARPRNGRIAAPSSYIPTPTWMSKSVVNIHNEHDENCFIHCCELAYQLTNIEEYVDTHDYSMRMAPADTSCYEYNYEGLVMPFHPINASSFERLNDGTALYIYYVANRDAGSKEKIIQIMYASKRVNAPEPICLLIISQPNSGAANDIHRDDLYLDPDVDLRGHHYLLIMDFDKFCRTITKKYAYKRFCRHCLSAFTTDEKWIEHCRSSQCISEEGYTRILPKKDTNECYKSFDQYDTMFPHPAVIYADTEAINFPVSVQATAHVPCSYCFYTVFYQHPEFNRLSTYHTTITQFEEYDSNGIPITEVGKHMIKALIKEKERILSIIPSILYPLNWNSQQQFLFSQENRCYFCKLIISQSYHRDWKSDERNAYKVPEYDMYKEIDNYVGAAHSKCHRKVHKWFYAKKDDKIGISKRYCVPILFHNFKKYDSQFILKSLDHTNYNIQCIPQSGDGLLTITFNGLRFTDTMTFIMASLENAVIGHLKDNLPFDHLRANLAHISDVFESTDFDFETRFKLLLRKGVYPYNWVNGLDKFGWDRLPPIEDFYDDLQQEDLDQKDYDHAQQMWSEFGFKTFYDYHLLYMVTDVLLLADVHSLTRLDSIKSYQLDPAYYLSLPGYAMQLLYRAGDVQVDSHGVEMPFEINLIDNTQQEIYDFFDRGIRGGISMIPHRLATANHPSLGKDLYNPNEPPTQLPYLDAYSLYAFCLSQALPNGEFEELTTQEVSLFDDVKVVQMVQQKWDVVAPDYGYAMEVDLHYPPDCHDFLRYFPPAPIKRAVQTSELSVYAQLLYQLSNSGRHDQKTEKLLCTLEDKERYIVYDRTLALYILLGVKVTKFHRVIRFRQVAFAKKFVEANIEARAKAKTKSQKDQKKLINNGAYGRCLMRGYNFRTITPITSVAKARKLISKPQFTKAVIVTSECVLMHRRRTYVKLFNPIAAAFVILDTAKWVIYDFYYNGVLATFGHERVRLLMTDTDSLLMEIQSMDWRQEMSDAGYDYYFDNLIGRFKIELAETIIRQFVALKAKMYSICTTGKVCEPPCRCPCHLNNTQSITEEIVSLNVDNLCICYEKKTAKGIKTYYRKNIMRHKQYLKTVLYQRQIGQIVERITVRSIQSIKNQLYTAINRKILMTDTDDKLYMVDEIEMLPYGHYKITDQRALEHE